MGPDFRRGEGREGSVPGETKHQRSAATSTECVGPVYAPDLHHRHSSAFTECSALASAGAHRLGDPSGAAGWPGGGPGVLPPSVLSQHTQDLISKIERVGDTTSAHDGETERGGRAHRAAGEDGEEKQPTPKSPRRGVAATAPLAALEVHIPRTVFYGVEEMLESKRPSVQSDDGREDGEGGRRVERRDSWRIGKPLSRIESLKEKIRQKEREKLRNMEAGVGDREGEGGEGNGSQGDSCEERREGGAEREGDVNTRKGGEKESRQEGVATHTDAVVYVRQEVGLLKSIPQLPVPASFSLSGRVEKESGGISIIVSEPESDSDEEEDRLRHEELRCGAKIWQRRQADSRGEEEELPEEEEEVVEYPSHSPSPPLPHSLEAMSRIYNLKTVGSRTALSLSERAVDLPSHIKVQPHTGVPQEASPAEGPEGRPQRGEGPSSDARSLQRQLENLQLREQEARRPSDDSSSQTSAGKPQGLTDQREARAQVSPRLQHPPRENHTSRPQHPPRENHTSRPQHPPRENHTSRPQQEETTRGPQQLRSPLLRPKQAQTSTEPRSTHSRSLLCPSHENSLKHPGRVSCPPTPSSSPCSPSPASSPSISPSPSPTLFTIRSASGAQPGKRGATITITPRKAAADGQAAGPIPPNTSKTSPTSTFTPKTLSQLPTLTEAGVGGKKRYPTAEEIQVIGGYQNLDRSCLTKSRGTSKGVKVCFDEAQLERVCEYPSETSLLSSTPHPHPQDKAEVRREEEEEEEEERGICGPKNTRSVGAATGRVLRVDESCPR
ncbi:phostensin [Osmerus eperlanus]|uniref:phostensin n=1 Tax=Osmerus eperlanus TaxID=29151 RepID=UPI002E158820